MSEIRVNDRVVVPEAALETKAVRASGPGGQNVNKLATKIQMRVDLDRIQGLEGDDLGRVREFLKSRLDAEGRLLVMSHAQFRAATAEMQAIRGRAAALVGDVTGAAGYRDKTGDTPRPDVNYVFPTFETTKLPQGLVGLIIAIVAPRPVGSGAEMWKASAVMAVPLTSARILAPRLSACSAVSTMTTPPPSP